MSDKSSASDSKASTSASTTGTPAPRPEVANKLPDPPYRPTPAPAAKAGSARDRLRSFEDELFGKDIHRIHGKVERGSGSRYQALTPEQRHKHDALEKQVAAEERVDAARQTVAEAEAALKVAEAETAAAAKD